MALLLYQSSSRLTYKVENGVEFHGKPILIEEARSQQTQSLKFDPRLRNTQIYKIYHHRKTLQLYHRKKTPTTIIQILLNEERKTLFFSQSIPKNLKMKDFNAAV